MGDLIQTVVQELDDGQRAVALMDFQGRMYFTHEEWASLREEIDRFYATCTRERIATCNQVSYDILFPKERPSTERREPAFRVAKPGFIYLVHATGTDHYKIGKTKDLGQRTKFFKLKLPFSVEVIHTFPSTDMGKTERDLHERFKDKRVNGEWFALDQDDVDWVCWIDEIHEEAA